MERITYGKKILKILGAVLGVFVFFSGRFFWLYFYEERGTHGIYRRTEICSQA